MQEFLSIKVLTEHSLLVIASLFPEICGNLGFFSVVRDKKKPFPALVCKHNLPISLLRKRLGRWQCPWSLPAPFLQCCSGSPLLFKWDRRVLREAVASGSDQGWVDLQTRCLLRCCLRLQRVEPDDPLSYFWVQVLRF